MIRILLGSKSEKKKRALENALHKLRINEFYISCLDSNSEVNSKPIGYEILRGAENRNKNSRNYMEANGNSFDYFCAIEGGFETDDNSHPYVVTYAIIEDLEGNKSTGKSLGVRISKDMFDYVKDGGSLNKVISEISGNEGLEIIEYLTNGELTREEVDTGAVLSALLPIVYLSKREKLNEKIKEKIKSKKSCVKSSV